MGNGFDAGARRVLALAKDLGFEWQRFANGHALLRHPGTGRYAEVPTRLTDDPRITDNYRLNLLDAAGRSTQGRVAPVGTRKAKRKPTGEARERAAREAARRDDAARELADRRLLDHARIQGLMGGRL